MKTLLFAVMLLFSGHVFADNASPLDEAAARAGLSTRPPRNPTKSNSPIVSRIYERNPEKGLDVEIIHRKDRTTEERPFVSLPILFVVGKDELLDETSRSNLVKMAAILKELCEGERAEFTIQGHTSAEGGELENLRLSEARAARIRAELVAHGVSSARISALGLGESAARFPETASETMLQQDRRVLVVRQK
ncbi:MAG TPA: OmpA family protein [Bacteroidia bacterium]|nr:OmpA family protein [Bacteroidia bacterium]